MLRWTPTEICLTQKIAVIEDGIASLETAIKLLSDCSDDANASDLHESTNNATVTKEADESILVLKKWKLQQLSKALRDLQNHVDAANAFDDKQIQEIESRTWKGQRGFESVIQICPI